MTAKDLITLAPLFSAAVAAVAVAKSIDELKLLETSIGKIEGETCPP